MPSLANSPAGIETQRRVKPADKQPNPFGLLLRSFCRRPGTYFAFIGASCLGGAIFANALLMQPERHPAPFFTSSIASVAKPTHTPIPLPPARTAETVEPAKRPDVTADIQNELTKRGFYVGPNGVSSGTSLENAIRDFQEAAGVKIDGQPTDTLLAQIKASKLTVKDQILQLLKPGQAQADQQKTLVQVQRALNKLGYGPLKEDGVFGGGSKAALEKFEKDRKLAVKGEPQGRVLRELASASGMAVE